MIAIWSLSSPDTSSGVSLQSSNTRTEIATASQSHRHTKSAFSRFLELLNSQQKSHRRAVLSCYLLLRKQRGICWLRRYCFFSALSQQVQTLLRSLPPYSTWNVQTLLTPRNESLTCVCFRWSTDDQHDHKQSSQMAKGKRSFPVVGKWTGVHQLSSIQETFDVVCINYGIEPLTEAINRPQHRFYINRFHCNRSMHTEKKNGTNVNETVHLFTNVVSTFRLCNITRFISYSILYASTEWIFNICFAKNKHKQLPSDLQLLKLQLT